MITEQGGGFPFQLGREIARNEIKMIVSQTTEAGIQTSMTGQGTDDQWENYRGCTNWGKRHYRDENRDHWRVGKQKIPLNLRARRSQFWCRTEDVRTIPEDDLNADRWKAEAPPRIGDTNERSQNKTARGGEMNKQSADEEREGSKLETRVTKLEEQTKWMYDRVAAAEASTWCKDVSWRQEDEGDDWRKWEGSWWIRVSQDDLNSRQRRKISRND